MTPDRSGRTGFERLMARHQALAGALIEPLGKREAADAAAGTLRAFVEEIRSAGVALSLRSERKAAQGILDFWSSILVNSPAARPEDCVPPLLAPPAAAPDAASQGPGAVHDQPLEGRAAASRAAPADDRSRIRIAAVARQYREADESGGYLLWGAALEEAAKYVDDDSDIARLVEDSRHAVARLRLMRRVIGLLLLAAAGLVVFGSYKVAEDRAQAADQQKKDEDFAVGRLQQADEYRKRLSELVATQLAAVETAKRMTDTLARFIAAHSAALDMSGLPEEARAEVRAVAERVAEAAPPPDYSLYNGYGKNFLGFELAAPPPPPDAPVLAYVNYSVAMHPERRMALYTASNLDRLQRKSLLRSTGGFAPDPRLEPARQPDPAWFGPGRFAPRHLVTRSEIAWGGYFDGEDASRRSEAVADVYPNAIPQFDADAGSLWDGLDRWVLSQFNDGASRVTIFTGPVFGEDDPDGFGATIPQRFWKVVVSVDPASNGTAVSDAFVISRTRNAGAGRAGSPGFDPALYRVPVTEVERLTGLDFGPVVRASQPQPFSASDAASDRGAAPFDPVAVVDGPDRKARLAAVDALVKRLRNAPEDVQLQLASALAAVLQLDRSKTLTATGRLNLAFVLSDIPAASWRKPSWASVRAAARRGVADLEKAASAGDLPVGPDTRGLLDTLKDRIGFGIGAGYGVDFQFAGMTRSTAVAASQGLKDLNWRISGEERTPKAANLNQIRYSDPDDEPAAQLLAGDLRALGWTKVTPARLTSPAVAKGRLEIWISE